MDTGGNRALYFFFFVGISVTDDLNYELFLHEKLSTQTPTSKHRMRNVSGVWDR